MMPNHKDSDMELELTPATLDQKPILENLLELYIHDFSEFLHREVGPDGRFGYAHLDLYWTDPQRAPLLLYVNRSLAGFVLIRRVLQHPSNVNMWDMAEFFVMRAFRRGGIGTRVALEVFK